MQGIYGSLITGLSGTKKMVIILSFLRLLRKCLYLHPYALPSSRYSLSRLQAMRWQVGPK